jgi:hypothetical protein
LRSQQPPKAWTTGFWFWHGSSTGITPASDTLDVLFIHVGAIRNETGPYAKEPWSVYGDLPDQVPPAREYWFVYRFERQGVPELEAAPILARQFSRLREAARARKTQRGRNAARYR